MFRAASKMASNCSLEASKRIISISHGYGKSEIESVTSALQRGGVVAVPTDTIYGVAALAQNREAVQKLYDIKGRNSEKPVAICVSELEEIEKWGRVSSVTKNVLKDLLPGPMTVVLRRTPSLNPDLNPTTSVVGIRIPDNDFIRDLSRACSQPLALTSANISSHRSTISIEEFKEIWPKIDLIADGGVLCDRTRQGSTVVDLSDDGAFKIIREGCAYEKTLDVLRRKYNLREESK